MSKAAYTDAEISRQAIAAVEIVRALGDEDEELLHDMIEGETGLFEAIEKDNCFVSCSNETFDLLEQHTQTSG